MVLLRRSALYFIGRIVPAVISVLGVAIYTRLLDPPAVSQYAVLLSVALLVTGISNGWLRNATLRNLSGAHKVDPDLPGTICLLFLAVSIPIVLILAVALHVFLPATSPALVTLTCVAV